MNLREAYKQGRDAVVMHAKVWEAATNRGRTAAAAAAAAAVARHAQEAALRGATSALIVEVLCGASAAMAGPPRLAHESDRERAGRVLPCAQIAAIINRITTRGALRAGRRRPRTKAPPAPRLTCARACRRVEKQSNLSQTVPADGGKP